MPSGSGPPGWWVGALVLIVLLSIVSILVRAAVLSRGRLNPLVDKEQPEVKLAQHLDHVNAEPPRKSLEDRLAELDDLHQRGLISDQELHDARAKVLADGS